MKSGGESVSWLRSQTNLLSVCVTSATLFLLYYDPLLLLWWPQKPAEKTRAAILPLDMAPGSIDDMFDGCRAEAASMIHLFGVFEWNFNRNFSSAWAVAERRAKKPAHRQLSGDHAIALLAFTLVTNIRLEFSRAVRTGKHKYNTYGFRFHYLYFYLTDAVNLLQRNSSSCRTVYRRTRTHFSRHVVHKLVRFGELAWASSSKQTLGFNGNVSCFEVETCLGADISYYSVFKQRGQVLIPPYEVFRVTAVLADDPWCTAVYKLQSTRTARSDLNCKLDDKEMRKYFREDATDWSPGFSLGIMSACLLLMFVISLVLIRRRQRAFVTAVLAALAIWTVILLILRESL